MMTFFALLGGGVKEPGAAAASRAAPEPTKSS
jgi:hypothetical protein